MKENLKQGTKQNDYNEDNLEQEFAQLITTISKEVSEEVVKATAVKSMAELNNQIEQFKSSAPELFRDIKSAEQLFSNTKNDVKAVLGDFAARMSKQDAMIKNNLIEVKRQYDLLSEGSYVAYKKAMDGQTTKIIQMVGSDAAEIFAELGRAKDEVLTKLHKQQNENMLKVMNNVDSKQRATNMLLNSIFEKIMAVDAEAKNEVIVKMDDSDIKTKKKFKILFCLLTLNMILLFTILAVHVWPYHTLIMNKLLGRI